jgi:rare lipoprotein A
MRTLLYTALTMATFGLLASAPANAASGWSCIGPHVACGGAHSAPRKAAKAHRSSHKRNYATRGKRHVAKSQARAHKSAQRADRRSTERRTAERRNKGAARTASAAGFSKAAYKGSGSHHGIASYYWQGQQTASGARFNPNALTAAHRTLPFGTKVRVTNKRNGRSVIVTINDRGPFIRGRVIDLSLAAAGVIGMKGAGLAPVSVERVGG